MPMVRVRFRKKASLHRVHLPHVHGHGPQGLRHLEPIGHTVHGEDAGRPEEPRRLHRQKPHGTASDHGHHVSRADPSHLGAMIAGGQDVPQEDRLVVGQVVGDRLEHDVGERDADSLGLRPGVCLPEPAAEHGPPVVAHCAGSRSRQTSQRPQLMENGAITRSPTRNRVTSPPTASTVPTNS